MVISIHCTAWEIESIDLFRPSAYSVKICGFEMFINKEKSVSGDRKWHIISQPRRSTHCKDWRKTSVSTGWVQEALVLLELTKFFLLRHGVLSPHLHSSCWKKGETQTLFVYPQRRLLSPSPSTLAGEIFPCSGCICAEQLSHVRLFVTPQTIASQAPVSMGFPRQGYWSGLPYPSPGDLWAQGSNLRLLHWQADSLLLCHLGSPVWFSEKEVKSFHISDRTFIYTDSF